jgi:hypothetical protein
MYLSAAIRPADGANDKHRFGGRRPDACDKLAAASANPWRPQASAEVLRITISAYRLSMHISVR